MGRMAVSVIEYRICWSANSNISFRGETDWEPWNGDEATENEVQDALSAGPCDMHGLQMALDASGFEWWAETRSA